MCEVESITRNHIGGWIGREFQMRRFEREESNVEGSEREVRSFVERKDGSWGVGENMKRWGRRRE